MSMYARPGLNRGNRSRFTSALLAQPRRHLPSSALRVPHHRHLPRLHRPPNMEMRLRRCPAAKQMWGHPLVRRMGVSSPHPLPPPPRQRCTARSRGCAPLPVRQAPELFAELPHSQKRQHHPIQSVVHVRVGERNEPTSGTQCTKLSVNHTNDERTAAA